MAPWSPLPKKRTEAVFRNHQVSKRSLALFQSEQFQ